MIQVSIKKNNVITNQATWPNHEEAQAWLNQETTNGSFGKVERWVREDQEDVSEAIDTREVVVTPEVFEVDEETAEITVITPAVTQTEYLLKAQFEVVIEDITVQLSAEAEKQAKIEAGKKAREACQAVLDYIAGANLDKELTIEQISQMQTTFANAEATLRAGRPTYAKMFISQIQPDGVIVTQTEKDACLDLLKDY